MFSLKSWFAALALWVALACSGSAQVSVLAHYTNVWSLHKGTSAPQSDWKMVGAVLDGTWQTNRPGGFGYASNANETNQVRTMLFDMAGARATNYTTFFIRQDFTVGSVDTNRHLSLVVDYDDGYIAFLDGTYLASANSPGAPNDPAFNARATAGHESSRGNGSPQPAVTNALGAVGSRLDPGTHTLAVIGLNDDTNSSDCILLASLYLVDAPTNPPTTNGFPIDGALTTDSTWYRTNSPYIVVGAVTINPGVTLTIEPGVQVLFNQGLSLNISGRLLAEGSPTDRIVFSRNAGANSWSTLEFLASSATSRVAHADIAYATGNIDANGSRLYLRDLWFTNTTSQMIDLVNSSITLLDSYFPAGSSAELLHFSTFPAGGHALIQGNVFGSTAGYNDIIDFTGGNRPGPIVQFLNNVFLAGVDDFFDMDGTDAHIEGNIFLNIRKDGSRDSSSNPITTGANGSDRSQLVVCRNLFYDCEHAFMEKDHGTALLQNNTILLLRTNAVSDNTDPDGNEAPGIIMFGEPWRSGPPPPGDGVIFEGNIAADLRLSDPWPILPWAQSFTGFYFLRIHNCIEGFPQPGVGNLSVDPLFVSRSNITAANILQSLALQPGSPCRGTGPNGLDMGALVPAGASVSGEPASPTTNTSATLTVAGPGIWSYRWRLNGGPWSAEVSLVPTNIWNGQPFTATMLSNAPPILLSDLANGSYTVEAIGRNSAGAWQDTNSPTVSKTWIVQTVAPLEIRSVAHAGNVTTFSFHAEAGQTYTVQFSDTLHPIQWQKLRDVSGQPTGDFEVMDINATGDSRFYRIVSPMQ